VLLDEVNQLDRRQFLDTFATVVDDAQWVAYGAWDFRPFRNALEVVAAFRAAIARASQARQAELVSQHASSPGDDDYQARFGFPLVVYERGQSTEQRAHERGRRMRNDPDLEFAVALDEVVKIIRRRIDLLID
jgi:uric acid transporter